MNCPYCHKEMKKGLIQSSQEISFIAGEKRKLFAKAEFYENSIALSEFSFWKGSAVVAYHCAECRKVIIDYSNDKADLNNR